MHIKRVVLIGGTGFVGRAVANRLAEAGVQVLAPTRRRSRAGHILLLPTMDVVEADVHDPATLERLFAGADAVVNLVGILHSRSGDPYGPDFARAHVELPKKIVAACRNTGIRRLVHISALGASTDGPSGYQRSKAAGEAAIRSTGADLDWVILRPSVIFGRDDNFLNMFACLASAFPVLPLAGAGTRFQPVYVEDVAETVWRSLSTPSAAGQTFDVAGPKVYTLRQLVEYASAQVGKPRPVIGLPESLGMIQAGLLELAPQPLMSRDNIRSMRVDNVTDGEPLPFGLQPTAIEAVVPRWLGDATVRAHYYPFRRHARR
ncbi:complex I NDUFA9 subunit family protein [Thauera linaloolentis]|uniref:NAD-dependent epimerase/dehydratase n=1 Tax=Thauera linaloolentis (strain DSM 12138 / JCM 21573 / CCUG 41526 / CIP 105981 / IAM 15112 / NBRC 102519 / 47Lol) TaxID=1123367 RepID=N6Y0J4_THAL4|nr:complex I NDUFA9 subunit family protein [Thauera linaloolentis]ENO85015.1 NAD-dependent epimerase/dehydratase [Thauera linaloolentis 47Lol = DSM 12138]MCM8566805.1 complex I NDUFA9 subunit family protein [Thauera linaloolentis]